MQITLPIPEFTRNERNFICDVLHITTDRVDILVLDDAIAAIQTSRSRPIELWTIIPCLDVAVCPYYVSLLGCRVFKLQNHELCISFFLQTACIVFSNNQIKWRSTTFGVNILQFVTSTHIIYHILVNTLLTQWCANT